MKQRHSDGTRQVIGSALHVQAITCLAIAFCCCKAVSIWVIGQDQINCPSFSSSKCQVQHASPFLRVGKADSGEVGVWQGLLGDWYGWR